ncbi:sugar transferase [Sphingomonas donggukensis]|uniref:Sugar transferase n=1 Tax=Sphingomonas donggukensis TaxID=2949093 RepID=A0ABY4TPY8_9SPHN|nr:sugar transferase [Sphingomonas donggukensis]URW74459.1 sugar transferase [Sphingomonas donggukensis]
MHSVSPLSRMRYQLGGALLVAGLLPYAWQLALEGTWRSDNPGLLWTLTAVLVAIVSGFYALRAISAYPGVKAGIFVIPAFLASYAFVFTLLVLTRIDYVRPVLFFSVLACVGWFLTIHASVSRARRMTIAIAPFGDVGDLRELDGVEWLWLTTPSLPDRPIDGVVADLRADMPDEWERMLAEQTLAGTMVYHVKQLREALSGRVLIDHLSENTFGSLMPVAAYVGIKRVLDTLVALALLPLFAIVFAVLYVVVKLDSPGPFIFRQQRVGYRGHQFTMFKIRTMRVPSRATDLTQRRAAAITADEDPRITRIGRFLRRMRIDELPQIANILRGEMSWIGPRPEAHALSEWYAHEIPFYAYRHIVRPGISGWAQVNQGHVAEVHEVHEKLQNDFYYIKYFSPWLDLLIVVRTLATVLTGFGAR